MAYTSSDFKAVFEAQLANYPAVQALYKAGDGKTVAHIEAFSICYAMLSAQLELSIAEPFEKTKDATVLADACLRGLLPKATPARVKIAVENKNTTGFSITQNRTLLDANNRIYRVDTPMTIAAQSTAFIEAIQVSVSDLTHTVTNTAPFYSIEIEPNIDDNYLSGLAVSDNTGNNYEYREKFVNTLIGDKAFTVESDVQGKLYIRFGWANKVGFQPSNNTVITIAVSRSSGDISLKPNAPFSFEYAQNTSDSLVNLKFDSVLIAGQNPLTTDQLREVCKYPSIYNNFAVFLNEFELLVRVNFGTLRFVSAWNEAIEENIRGASLNNSNTLFVACVSDADTEMVLTESTPVVSPQIIADNDLTATQQAIKAVLLKADNTYNIRFYTAIIAKWRITITATVSYANNASIIQSAISELILLHYGIDAMSGQKQVLNKDIHNLLKSNILPLNDRNADLVVNIAALNNKDRPELWRYVDNSSLTVTVNYNTTAIPSWG